MDTDLDTLATALYVTTDDLLRAHPERVPPRPKIGITPRTSDAKMLTLAVMQALLGYTNETQWLRYARKNLLVMFPTLPLQSGYNKRLRKLAATMTWLVAELGRQTSIADDGVWVVDSTPVECARSRETVKRSDLAGWAEYGYCASHSRFFWGLRLHLVCTLHGLPVGWALSGAKADEREVLEAILAATPALARPGRQVVIADKAYYGRLFEAGLDQAGVDLLRKPRKGERPRPRPKVLQAATPDHRVGQRDLQDPTRHRTPSRQDHRWSLHPHRSASPRSDRRDLAQRPPRTRHRRSLIAYDH